MRRGLGLCRGAVLWVTEGPSHCLDLATAGRAWGLKHPDLLLLLSNYGWYLLGDSWEAESQGAQERCPHFAAGRKGVW